MSTNPRDVVAQKAADHFGWRPFDEMAKDKADLRLKMRDGRFDVNEPTQSDCLDFADAILSALQPAVSEEVVEAARKEILRIRWEEIGKVLIGARPSGYDPSADQARAALTAALPVYDGGTS